MTPAPLTKQQARVLDAFVQGIRAHGHTPTLREVGAVLGLSKATVFGHVREIARKGHVTVTPRIARGVLPTHVCTCACHRTE